MASYIRRRPPILCTKRLPIPDHTGTDSRLLLLSCSVGSDDPMLGYKYECRGDQYGEEVSEIHSGTAEATAGGLLGFGIYVILAVVLTAIITFSTLRRIVLFGCEVGIF